MWLNVGPFYNHFFLQQFIQYLYSKSVYSIEFKMQKTQILFGSMFTIAKLFRHLQSVTTQEGSNFRTETHVGDVLKIVRLYEFSDTGMKVVRIFERTIARIISFSNTINTGNLENIVAMLLMRLKIHYIKKKKMNRKREYVNDLRCQFAKCVFSLMKTQI